MKDFIVKSCSPRTGGDITEYHLKVVGKNDMDALVERIEGEGYANTKALRREISLLMGEKEALRSEASALVNTYESQITVLRQEKLKFKITLTTQEGHLARAEREVHRLQEENANLQDCNNNQYNEIGRLQKVERELKEKLATKNLDKKPITSIEELKERAIVALAYYESALESEITLHDEQLEGVREVLGILDE